MKNILLNALVALLGLSAWTTTMIVETDEVAVIYRFGAVSRVVQAGLSFRLPYPIERDERIHVTEIRTADSGKALFLTGDANLVEARPVAQYTISEAVKYSTMVTEPDLVMKDVLMTAITFTLSKQKVDPQSFINRSALQSQVKKKTQELADKLELGVRIESIELPVLTAPMDVQEAFNEVSSAKGDKETMILSAQTYKSKKLPDTRGEASRRIETAKSVAKTTIAKAEANTDRYKEILQAWKDSPESIRRELLREFWVEIEPKIKTIITSADSEVFLEHKGQ